MRVLKLVIWDLDETILTGILAEGDDEVNPVALEAIHRLNEWGVLQALATQNPPEIGQTVRQTLSWANLFLQIEADLGPKIRKIQRIIDNLEVNPLDVAFVDDDPFERDAIAAQIPDITPWSVADLAGYLVDDSHCPLLTTEARQRPQMYQARQTRRQAEASTSDYTTFLRTCNIQITIRPYVPPDADRAEELLTRTHRMNLGVLPVDEAIARLNQPAEHHILIAEMKDIYGDMGRCGLIHLTPTRNRQAVIESLAISCRTRARGLSLAMFIGLLRHPLAHFQTYRCRYLANGANRPLRMLLLGAGFKPQPGTDELLLHARQVQKAELPDWIHLIYQPFLEGTQKAA